MKIQFFKKMNVKQRADDFSAQMHQRASVSRTNNILVTFGSDFQYINALMNFKNLYSSVFGTFFEVAARCG